LVKLWLAFRFSKSEESFDHLRNYQLFIEGCVSWIKLCSFYYQFIFILVINNSVYPFSAFSNILCVHIFKDTEVYERVKKLVENSLRSGFLPARIAGLHGILYLLQATPARTPAQHVQTSSGPVSEEIYHIQPVAIEYIQKHIDIGSG
jgi:hypothetical protein